MFITCMRDYFNTLLMGRIINKNLLLRLLRIAPGILLLATLGLWAACGRFGAERLNVLLVSFDTTRADHLSCYGYPAGTSPAIDRLASEGLRFSRVYTPTPITLSAHTSLFTGADPTLHGVRSNGMFRLSRGFGTLAEGFREAGYRTAGFVGAFVLDRRYGLAQGFDTWSDDMITGGRRTGVLLQRELRAETVTGRALDWLRDNHGHPFFLFVHYFDPHRPFEAPEPWPERFANPYDAEIAYADSQLSRLLAALDSLAVDGRTIVAVCADHGEGLGEHGEETHATFIYNSTVHVPLVLRVPGRADLAGKVSSRESSLVDVAPTLAALCGIKPPEHCQGFPLIQPAGAAELSTERPVYLECYYPYYSHGWSPLEGLVQEGKKYIRAPEPELYDLARDPGELDNLALADSAGAESLAGVLSRFKAQAGHLKQSAPAPSSAPSGEEASSLRALGYVAGHYSPPPADFRGLADPKRMIASFRDYMLGVTYMADGRLDLAAAEFDRILAGDSTNYSVWEFLAETELLRQNFSAAEQAALRSVRAPQPSERAYFCLGMSRLFLGDSTAADSLMDRTLGVNRDYGPALAIKARLLDSRGKPELALDFYLAARKQMPDNPDLLTDLGSCLIELASYEQAAGVLELAEGLEGASWRAGFNLGVALQHQGLTEKAAAAYSRAVELPGAGKEAFNNLGICLFSLGRYEESGKAYGRALELDSLYAETWNNLAGTLAARGKLREAAGAYSRSLELQPCYPDACFNYGLLLAEKLSLPDSAVTLIGRGLALAPDNPRKKELEAVLRKLRDKQPLH